MTMVAVASYAWNEWVVSDSSKDPAAYLAKAFDVLGAGWDTLDESGWRAP